MNKDIYILAIETSCDETSMAIIKNGTEVVSNTILTQIDTHKSFGGVVPEIASRMHTESILMVLEETLEKSIIKIEDVDAIAVTYAPGLLGSLLIGIECAKTLAMIYKKPLIAVNHTVGHIYANNLEHKMEFPLLALIISGGHTDLVYMKNDYDIEFLGSSIDDSIGEVYDKVARVLSLPYPGGPSIEKLAKEGQATYNLPKSMMKDSYDFSYSGLKSSIINLVHNEKQRGSEIRKEDLASSFQEVAVEQLLRKTEKALTIYNAKQFILAGGVSANKYIREEMNKLCQKYNIPFHVPELKYCTDNAAMIGAAAYPLYKNNKFADYSLNGSSNENIKIYFEKFNQE